MADSDRLKAAMNGSIRFSQAGQNQESRERLDEAIAEAIPEGRSSWIPTLSRHAAVLGSHRATSI